MAGPSPASSGRFGAKNQEERNRPFTKDPPRPGRVCEACYPSEQRQMYTLWDLPAGSEALIRLSVATSWRPWSGLLPSLL